MAALMKLRRDVSVRASSVIGLSGFASIFAEACQSKSASKMRASGGTYSVMRELPPKVDQRLRERHVATRSVLPFFIVARLAARYWKKYEPVFAGAQPDS